MGTGSGYQAAILAELVAKVYTIEIVEPLGRRTMQVLDELGYRNVEARIGDGYNGWPEAARVRLVTTPAYRKCPLGPGLSIDRPDGHRTIAVEQDGVVH